MSSGPFSAGLVDNDGTQLFVERIGSGPLHVVFAHGWISSRRMWYEVVQRLDQQRFTLHLFDFRGCGLSDRPLHGHTFEGYVSDLLAVLRSVGKPVALAGHSMGARLAQFVATRTDIDLTQLILVAPGSPRCVKPNEKQRKLAENAFGSRARIAAFQRAAMGRALSPAVMERIVEDALVCQRESWFGWFEEGRLLDFSHTLAHVSAPTIAIAGEKDPLATAARVKRDVAGAIPECLFVLLKNAGHNLPVETPDEVAGAISRFVR